MKRLPLMMAAGWMALAAMPLKAAETVEDAAVSQAPAVPAPIERSGGRTVKVRLETNEVKLVIKKGIEKDTVYPAWTFNGHIPGPIIRVKEGDTLEVHLVNPKGSVMPHNVDFHAVTGPGGGAAVTLGAPGTEKVARFKMLAPGVFMYHCAAPPVTWHIANGMYGMIIVEPKKSLPKVDKEFAIVQSEFYTKKPFGAEGLQEFNDTAADNEKPTYVVFNGSADSLTGDKALKLKVGDRVRLWGVDAGPNLVSSFHIIGVIFDKLYNLGSFENPLSNVQTVLVPAGGAFAAEFQVKVPGTYSIVDHSIFRVQKGAFGTIVVEGAEAPEIYKSVQ